MLHDAITRCARASSSETRRAANVAQLICHAQVNCAGEHDVTLAQHDIASAGEVQALLDRIERLASACGQRTGYTKGGGNHARRLTELGHVRALLAAGPASTAQVRACHTLARALLSRLNDGEAGS